MMTKPCHNQCCVGVPGCGVDRLNLQRVIPPVSYIIHKVASLQTLVKHSLHLYFVVELTHNPHLYFVVELTHCVCGIACNVFCKLLTET